MNGTSSSDLAERHSLRGSMGRGRHPLDSRRCPGIRRVFAGRRLVQGRLVGRTARAAADCRDLSKPAAWIPAFTLHFEVTDRSKKEVRVEVKTIPQNRFKEHLVLRYGMDGGLVGAQVIDPERVTPLGPAGSPGVFGMLGREAFEVMKAPAERSRRGNNRIDDDAGPDGRRGRLRADLAGRRGLLASVREPRRASPARDAAPWLLEERRAPRRPPDGKRSRTADPRGPCSPDPGSGGLRVF